MSDSSPPGLFGDGASGGGYIVLARKYRPRTFSDLIGQEAMVRTIANSFALSRVPHAYMLTGVRGVGKTTTARLLARALNYARGDVKAPQVELDPMGENCRAIMESNHPDVFEMDAASRTGIGDIREILDSVRYAPVMARYKVYIIDEVHMLSTQAFNGLLKTLEEPPPHVKFIFATTEIRKVPVTVLSRCQRFDLKRIDSESLAEHLGAICAKEGVKVELDGLALIARAAEGSVRDGLSLLDQALVQKPGATVTAADVREMLGLADRGRVLDLFEAIARGDAKTAISEARSQYDSGADPTLILRDLLDIGHEAARAQALGSEARIIGGADWVARVRGLAEQLSPAQLSRLWQMLLKALEEAGKAPDPIAAVEMAMVRLCAAQSLPPPEDAARLLREGAPSSWTAGASPTGAPALSKSATVNTATSQSAGEAPAVEAGPVAYCEEHMPKLRRGPRAHPGGPRHAYIRARMFEDIVNSAATDNKLQHLFEPLERMEKLHLCFKHAVLEFRAAPDQPPDFAEQLTKMMWDDEGIDWHIRAIPVGAQAQGCRGAPEHEVPIHQLHSFEDVVRLVAHERMVDLELALERMRVVHFDRKGEIVYAQSDDLPRDLVRTLKPLLEEDTGIDWRIRASTEVAPVESLSERRKREDAKAMEELKRQPFVAEALKAFPGAEIVQVKAPADENAPPADVAPFPKRDASAPSPARKKEV